MPMPLLTAEQRQAASAKAVAARRTRAEVSAALKRGELSVADVLARAEHDEAVAGMRALTLVESLPRYGKVRAGEVLARLHITPGRRLRGLGQKQRADLLGLGRP